MLPRTTYRKVLKMVNHYRQQHLQDRLENPDRIPCAWGMSIQQGIERICREDHVRYDRQMGQKVMEYLVQQRVLILYVGDYTFPTAEALPTREEIEDRVQQSLRRS